jgi:LmbE family N-acetylglucosaminyl deacetylase
MNLSGRTLLGVFAHPDDESLACGGLLALCATAGAHVTIVCATHGENNGGRRDLELFETRPLELRRAADALGVPEVVVFEYADGFLPWMDAKEFETRLVGEIRRLNADVVVTFGDDGLYWHPDHIAIHERTTAAVASMGADAPALYYATIPPGQMRNVVNEWSSHAGSSQNAAALFGVGNADAFGLHSNAPTLVLDVSRVTGRKLAALQCHRSQVAGGPFEHLNAEAAARLLAVEHFHRADIPSSREPFIEKL